MVCAVFPPVFEAIHTLLNDILQRLRVYFVQPWIYLLERDKLGLRREAGHTVPAAYPVHRHIVQRTVVCDAAAAETPGEKLGLLHSRIKTVFIRSQHITNLLKFIDNHKKKSMNLRKYPSLWTRLYFAKSVGHISEKTVVKYIVSQKSKTLSSPG